MKEWLLEKARRAYNVILTTILAALAFYFFVWLSGSTEQALIISVIILSARDLRS